ncbi:MAG: fumarate hydratase, partial [Acidimicrobiia bacterium]|nr:fumarate hydratase [Acidimicrobiia bacterium]
MDFSYEDTLPASPGDVPFRLLTANGVRVVEAGGRRFLEVDDEAIRLLTAEAMRDMAHLLRPGHLQQLRNILDDPEASANDRFVATELLRNANIAAGGVLPGCQ